MRSLINTTIEYNFIGNIMEGWIPGGGGGRPPKIGKKYDFSHEIPQIFSRLPSLGAIFLSAPPPNLKSWIRPCNDYRGRLEYNRSLVRSTELGRTKDYNNDICYFFAKHATLRNKSK